MKNNVSGDEIAAGTDPLAVRSGVREALLELLEGRPELASRFGHFQAAFADQGLVPERLLDICRLRIDALHRLPAVAATVLAADEAQRVRSGDFSLLSVTEVAALALAEQMTIDAHGVDAGQISELGRALGEPGVVTLLTAVALLDTNARMQRVLQPLREQRLTMAS
jgi:alkylhydroperoxidase family enzyme